MTNYLTPIADFTELTFSQMGYKIVNQQSGIDQQGNNVVTKTFFSERSNVYITLTTTKVPSIVEHVVVNEQPYQTIEQERLDDN